MRKQTNAKNSLLTDDVKINYKKDNLFDATIITWFHITEKYQKIHH